MALEVPNITIVVRGEEANGIVDLSTRVDNALRVMGEPCKMNAILLTPKLLCVFSFLAVVDLERVVVACDNGKLACIVEVERGN